MTAVLLVAALVAAVAASPFGAAVASRVVAARSHAGTRHSRSAFPALVDALAAALASGLALPMAFAEIAPTVPAPLADATRRAAASLTLGIRVADALVAYSSVVPDEDVAPLALVLAAFTRTGGRVSGSLERVGSLLRGRLALAEERSALTAQSRASAAVLLALAPLGALFFSFAMPDYASTLIHDGVALVLAATAFEAVGAIWLWRIVRASEGEADLASFLDAVVVGLDAGLTFERALAGLVERVPRLARGADARRLLADLRLGAGLSRALRAFATGPDEARIAALVATSARFGSPLAHLLVLQADALRETERHRAEAKARRMPILMLFPLALCILPALLLVFLGPPLLSLLR